MKIAVNCWILRNKNVDGIGNFCIETLIQMTKAHPEDEFILLCDKNFTETYFNFPNVKIYRIFPPYRHPLLYIWWMEIVVKRFLKKHRFDIFVGMEGFLSVTSRIKQLPVIHDLNFEHYPQDLPFRNRFYYKTFMPAFARKAARIATVSAFTKHDIVDKYRVDEDRIDVVYCGIKEKFRKLTSQEIAQTQQNFTNGLPYFFFVGSMHPRKNVVRLILAYDMFRKNNIHLQHKLVLSGNILWNNKMFDEVLNKISCRSDIVFTGRVSDDVLKLLLGSATALAFVPVFEGFGIPIVEAFQAEVPVVCSKVTSMPEVADGAALLVDPFNEKDIADALKQLAENESLREDLIQKGNKRKQFFSWQKTAGLLYESISKVVNTLV